MKITVFLHMYSAVLCTQMDRRFNGTLAKEQSEDGEDEISVVVHCILCFIVIHKRR